MPKHIVVEDMFASVNYFNNLCHGIGSLDDIDHLGQPPPALRRRVVAEPVPHWSVAYGARGA